MEGGEKQEAMMNRQKEKDRELEAIKRQHIIITSLPSLSIMADLSTEKATREQERVHSWSIYLFIISLKRLR